MICGLCLDILFVTSGLCLDILFMTSCLSVFEWQVWVEELLAGVIRWRAPLLAQFAIINLGNHLHYDHLLSGFPAHQGSKQSDPWISFCSWLVTTVMTVPLSHSPADSWLHIEKQIWLSILFLCPSLDPSHYSSELWKPDSISPASHRLRWAELDIIALQLVQLCPAAQVCGWVWE